MCANGSPAATAARRRPWSAREKSAIRKVKALLGGTRSIPVFYSSRRLSPWTAPPPVRERTGIIRPFLPRRTQLMGEALILLATNFLWGAYHAIQPGHGKTIAAAYIVGARGRPVDAWILGIFVTLSHTSGIVLVGMLASIGLPGLESKRIEVWLKVLTGVLIIAIGLWTLWTQRGLLREMRGRDGAGGGGA